MPDPRAGWLRTAAAARDLRVRTARMDGAVVVARLDADLWQDDAATMRCKLAPPPDPSRIRSS